MAVAVVVGAPLIDVTPDEVPAGVLGYTVFNDLSARVHQQALWLSSRRRTWCRHGALAVLCLVRVRGVQRVEDDVLVVSIDRLMPAVRSAAGAVLLPSRCGR